MKEDILLGYADQISVRPGELIRCMISCSDPTYSAQLVRLIHGDPNPNGPGLLQEAVDSTIEAFYDGRLQTIPSGSYISVEHQATLTVQSGFTLQCWILPTTPSKGLQGLVTKWNGSLGAGYGLFIAETGCLSLGLAQAGQATWVGTSAPLRSGSWYFVAATFDFSSGRAHLWQRPLNRWKDDPTRCEVECITYPEVIFDTQDCLCMAAFLKQDNPERVMAGHFNGKIDSPRLFSRALSEEEIEALYSDVDSAASLSGSLLGAWDFSSEMESGRILDRSPFGHHGAAINMPTRAVTGRNWDGETFSRFQDMPDRYGANSFSR